MLKSPPARPPGLALGPATARPGPGPRRPDFFTRGARSGIYHPELDNKILGEVDPQNTQNFTKNLIEFDQDPGNLVWGVKPFFVILEKIDLFGTAPLSSLVHGRKHDLQPATLVE